MKTLEDIIGRVVFVMCGMLGIIFGITYAIKTHPQSMDLGLGVLAFAIVGFFGGLVVGLILVFVMFGITSLFK